MKIITSSNPFFSQHIVVCDGESFILCEKVPQGETPSLDDMLFYNDGSYFRAVIVLNTNPFDLVSVA